MPVPAGPAGATTANDLIEATRWHLMTGVYEEVNPLAGPVDDTQTTWTFSLPLRAIREGAVLSVGLEQVLVTEATDSAGTANVIRGYVGTTAASHGQGELVTVNPRFPDVAILRALNDDLRSLSGLGLYRVGSATIVYDGTIRTYDLAADVLDVLDVRYSSSGSTDSWPVVDSWEVLQDMPTAEFASGKALHLTGRVESGRDVLVRYRKSFGLLTSLSDDVETVTGLWPEAMDIPPLGAAIKLAAARDIRRTDTIAQGDTRRANEVPAGTPQGAVRTLMNERQLRIGQEQARLYSRYPLQRRSYRRPAGRFVR